MQTLPELAIQINSYKFHKPGALKHFNRLSYLDVLCKKLRHFDIFALKPPQDTVWF
jgi:hypothetical protein